ncbi:hypothetical protein PSTG_19518, partial [Puccinia striiformis f. sp. tritici PST-78]
RAGNLRALLDRPEFFPDALKPYVLNLQNLYNPKPFVPKYFRDPLKSESLTSSDCQKLVDYLNAKSGHANWAISSEWTYLSKADKRITAPLSSQCQLHRQFTHKDVEFSTWMSNPNNSIISVALTFPKVLHFARIEQIFTHVRRTTSDELISDTWLK